MRSNIKISRADLGSFRDMGSKNIRVLYIVNGGGPTSIPLEVAETITSSGIDLTVAVFKEEDEDASHFDCPFVPIGADSIWDLQGVHSLHQCIVKHEPDVIHVHHTASAFWGSILAKLIAGTAVVRTEHSSQRHYSLPQSILHGCSQLLADRILCNSKSTYRNLYPLQKWVIGDNWGVVYNGIDVSRIDAAANRVPPVRFEELDDRVLIGSVGRLVDAKNYRRLLQAFPSVLADFPEAHLVLVGDGENRYRLEQEAVAQGIKDQVTFMGECPRDDVYALLHRFDLFVMPSLWEGFCNAVVEAMAAGLPIISSDISTLREVLGEMATYVNPKSPKDIARGIIEVIEKSKEEKEKWSYECRNRAISSYSINRTIKKYVESYHGVVSLKV